MARRVGNYELGKVLGQGAFGIVRLGTNMITKEEFAVKIIDKEKVKREDLIENLKKEIQILMIIEHPNIVKLIEVLASKTKIYLILEWVRGGELFELFKTSKGLSEQQMRIYFRQIVRALQYCQSKQIAHRDLKPENILICYDSEQVKINDFGLSAVFLDSSNFNNELYTTCGTVNYLAPEVIQSSGYDGHKADIWALGVILYFGCAGYLPFEEENVVELLNKIVAGAFVEFPKTFTKEIKDMISKILIPFPNKRISLEGIVQHPWFQEQITEEELSWFTDQGQPGSKQIKQLYLSQYIQCPINSNIKFIQLQANSTIRTISGIEMIAFLTGRIANNIIYNPLKVQTKQYSCFTTTMDLETVCNLILMAFNHQQPTSQHMLDQEATLKFCFRYTKKYQLELTVEILRIQINSKLLINIQHTQGSGESYQHLIEAISKDLLVLKQ